LIERLVSQLDAWGMVAPALMFLEANKPLSFLGSQMILLSQPVLGLIWEDKLLGDYALLLEDRENVERLLCHLEDSRG
jgi:hypothetical protein